MADNAKVKVLEVDQWTSTGNVAGTKMEDWVAKPKEMLETRSGEHAESARTVFGGHAVIREVYETSEPSMGNVWFRPNENGILRRWKFRCDSGD